MSARIIPHVFDTSERKSGRFFILLCLLLVASSVRFNPSMTQSSDTTPVSGNYSASDSRGFLITMTISVGCTVFLILYFVVLCLRKVVKKRIIRQNERANTEMGLIRNGSSVSPRLASAVSVSVDTGFNSLRPKASISYPSAVYV